MCLSLLQLDQGFPLKSQETHKSDSELTHLMRLGSQKALKALKRGMQCSVYKRNLIANYESLSNICISYSSLCNSSGLLSTEVLLSDILLWHRASTWALTPTYLPFLKLVFSSRTMCSAADAVTEPIRDCLSLQRAARLTLALFSLGPFLWIKLGTALPVCFWSDMLDKEFSSFAASSATMSKSIIQ